jgi:hypothetical protein
MQRSEHRSAPRPGLRPSRSAAPTTRPRAGLSAKCAAAGCAIFASCAAPREAEQPAATPLPAAPPGVQQPAELPPPSERGTPPAVAASGGSTSGASATPIDPAAQESSAPAVAAAPKAEAEDAFPIHGSLSSRYRFRTGGDGRDQDLYESLVLDLGDARTNGFTAHVMATLFADLDGRRDRENQFVFPSLADTFDEPVQPLLYQAYVDITDPPLVSELRVGRQFDYFTPEFAHFDGLRIASKAAGENKLSGGAYGGVPVRLYEATSSGDSIFGLWGEAQPWKGGRVRLDWMHVEDDDRFGANSNDLLGASLWQRLSARARVDARYTRLEEQDRDLRVRGYWDDGEADFRLQASYYQLLETQQNFANEFDPFFSTLQSYSPFSQYRLQGSKGLTKITRLDAGVDLRQVEDAGDEGPFNRDFDREWVSFVLLDTPWTGLALTATADFWNGDGRDIETWGVDATREFDGGYRWSLGSSYQLFRYDYFTAAERDNVRVWYLRMRKQFSRSGSVDLRYDYEDFDDDTFHVVLAGATWRF